MSVYVNLMSANVNKRPLIRPPKYIDFDISRKCPSLRNLLYKPEMIHDSLDRNAKGGNCRVLKLSNCQDF